jgi:hypothetical protein
MQEDSVMIRAPVSCIHTMRIKPKSAIVEQKEEKIGDHGLSQGGYGLGAPEGAAGGRATPGDAGQHGTREPTREEQMLKNSFMGMKGPVMEGQT